MAGCASARHIPFRPYLFIPLGPWLFFFPSLFCLFPHINFLGEAQPSALLGWFLFAWCCFSPQKNPRMCPTSVTGFYCCADGKARLDFWENSGTYTKGSTRHNPVLENSQDSKSHPAPPQSLPRLIWGSLEQLNLSAMGIPSPSLPWPWTDPGASCASHALPAARQGKVIPHL